MRKFSGILIVLFIAGGSAFAQKSITLKEVKADPNPVKQGRYVKVTAEFTGKQKKLKSVQLYSREYGNEAPDMKLIPDKDPKLNVWTYEFQVPYEVPAGTYNMEIKALDKKGKEVVSESCIKCVYGKTGELQITVTN